eukprot:4003869-Alexandrium_andersonii.AAC.1
MCIRDRARASRQKSTGGSRRRHPRHGSPLPLSRLPLVKVHLRPADAAPAQPLTPGRVASKGH